MTRLPLVVPGGPWQRLVTALALTIVGSLAIFPPSAARATTMVDVPLDDLIARADLVVRGTVLRKGTRVKMSGGTLEPRTHIWIHVDELIDGDAPGNGVVHLWEPGGEYEGVQTTVAGAPNYEVGEQVVVFLSRDPEQPELYRTLEMTQGKYHVMSESFTTKKMVVRDLSDVSMVRWRRNRMQVGAPPVQKPISIESLMARVRALSLSKRGHKKEVAR